MTLIKVDPFRAFDSISKRMAGFSKELEKGVSFETGGLNPRADIIDEKDKVTVVLEMAGIKKEDISIKVDEERTLTISGEKTKPELEEGRSIVRVERSFGKFKRSFMLSEMVDIEKIDAKYEDGILSIALAKKEPEKPKEINVEIK